jgi:NADH-quinone oxidoreductase subunit M
VALTIFFGLHPSPILDVTAVSVKKLVASYEAAVRPAKPVAAPTATTPAPAPAHKEGHP